MIKMGLTRIHTVHADPRHTHTHTQYFPIGKKTFFRATRHTLIMIIENTNSSSENFTDPYKSI